MDLPNRKKNRLENFDYGQNGSYFLTICVKDRKRILSNIIIGTGIPTNQQEKIDNRNSFVARFVSTFKRFCNKEYGKNIWQARYFDHIIRNQHDYDETWKYIDNNPINWILKHKTQDGD